MAYKGNFTDREFNLWLQIFICRSFRYYNQFTLFRRIYIVFSGFWLSRFQNEELHCLQRIWAFNFIHCDQRVQPLSFLERRIYIVFSVFWLSRFQNEELHCLACLGFHVFRTKNIHCVQRVLPFAVAFKFYTVISVFSLPRFQNDEYTLCLACFAFRGGFQVLHCDQRVQPSSFLERRIYIVFSVFCLSRFQNEEYTLCLAHLGFQVYRTRNIHCVQRIPVFTLSF